MIVFGYYLKKKIQEELAIPLYKSPFINSNEIPGIDNELAKEKKRKKVHEKEQVRQVDLVLSQKTLKNVN